MRWLHGATRSAALLGLARRQDAPADSVVVVDAETGFTFGEYVTDNGISYRVALPDPVPADGGFDVVVQVAAPISVGWAGLAWGGSMTYNPLSISWQNGNNVVQTSRYAYGYYVPPAYPNATYTILPKGTHVNATHWQYTAKCTGCTSWGDDDIGYTTLDAHGQNPLAFAFSSTPPDDPSNPASTFTIHDSVGHWYHDFGSAGNADFSDLVAKNSEGPATTSTSAAAGSGGPPSTTSAPTSSRSITLTLTMSMSSNMTMSMPMTTSGPSSSRTPTNSSSTSSSAVTISPTSTNQAGSASSFPTSCQGVSAPHFNLSLADGWKVTKIAGNLIQPRTAIFDPAGNLLVVQAGYGISLHTFGPDGCIDNSTTVIRNPNLNHGLALSPDGAILYASSETTAWRWSWNPSTRTATNQTTIVKAMSNRGHSTRSLYVVPGHPNLLLVTVGSNDNWDYDSESAAVGRAAVKIFDMDKVPDGGYTYASDGYQFGYGLRNEVGLVFDPSNMVWGVENGGDDFKRTVNGTATDIHIDNPADELNYLGDPTKPNNQWYGYPTCHTVWNPSLFVDKTFKTGDQFVVTPNATFNDADCAAKSKPPRLAFQAHSAPITAAFGGGSSSSSSNGNSSSLSLFVTLHGSWDRAPATGYKVVEVPFRGGADTRNGTASLYEPVAPPDSREGYNDVLWAPGVGACSSSSCFRPAALLWDKARSRLVVSSDNAAEGELFVLGRA